MANFRFATLADLDSLLELMECYYAEDGYPFEPIAARSAATELLHHEHLGRLWVAVEGQRVVGYLAVTLGFSLEYRGRDAFLDELYLAPGARGRGLGKQALAIACEYCELHGVNALHLEVESHRETAKALYRRSGFEDHERSLMTKRLR